MRPLSEPYTRFAKSAARSLGVISLNWDLVCELAFEEVDEEWSYSVGRGTPIIKPHGSLNWTNHLTIPQQKWRGGNGFAQVDDASSISYCPSNPFQNPLCEESGQDFQYMTCPGTLQENVAAASRLWVEAKRVFSNSSCVVFIGYSMPTYDQRVRHEFARLCSGKRVVVVNPCESALVNYESVFPKHNLSCHPNRFEETPQLL